MRRFFKALVLIAVAAPCAAQATAPRVIEMTPPEGKASTPQCSGGVVYDHGTFDAAYSMGNGDPGDASLVMRFTLPAGTNRLDQVCGCFTRVDDSSPSSMSYEAVAYGDDAPGGGPGTLLGAVSATANAIPVVPGYQFYSIDFTAAGIVLPSNVVYIGMRWPGGDIALCGDRTATTTQRPSYGSGNSGASWSSTQVLYTTPPRALGVRADPAATPTACVSSATTLCLNNGRFRVEASFETTDGQSGPAHVIRLTDETGYMWFFDANNVELVVKVLNACSYNQRYWVYSSGLTDVGVDLTVTDTQTGEIKIYSNPLGHPFPPKLDSSAFATCP